MSKILTIIYIINFILILISIINLIRANKYLNKGNNNLKQLIEAKEANQELRFQNSEYEEMLNKIKRIVFEDTCLLEKINKIIEVIKNFQPNNF